ncbi:MAG: hypothetical protein AB1576_03945 [Bacillota bacterium]
MYLFTPSTIVKSSRSGGEILAITWDSMATPVLALTKADRCPDIDTRVTEVESVAPGVDVIVASSLSDEGLAPCAGT